MKTKENTKVHNPNWPEIANPLYTYHWWFRIWKNKFNVKVNKPSM